MNLKKTTLTVCTALAVFIASSVTADAAVDLTLQQGSGGGFSFSWLHTATSPASGTGASKNGTKVQLGNGTNTVNATLDALNDVLTILGTEPDPLAHSALGSVDANSLRFTGGVLSVENGVYGGGYIDYAYEDGGGAVTGTFYFNDVHEVGSGSPNGTSPNSGSFVDPVVNIAEWGNNWMYDDGNGGTTLADEWGFLAALEGSRFTAADFDQELDRDIADASGTRLGIDLRATGTIPEPVSLIVWWLLASTVAVSLRRRR